MKKAISLLCVFALILALAPAAFADGIDVFFSAGADVINSGDTGVTAEYTRVGNLAIFKQTADGIQELADLAASGFTSSWAAFVDAMLEEYKTVSDYAATIIGTDYVLVYSVASNKDPQSTLLLIVDGEVLYDAARGINVFGFKG